MTPSRCLPRIILLKAHRMVHPPLMRLNTHFSGVKVREEAEEVAQDTFIKAYESLSDYRGEAKFSSWLYSIAYRKALDRVRKYKRNRELELIEEITEHQLDEVENALAWSGMRGEIDRLRAAPRRGKHVVATADGEDSVAGDGKRGVFGELRIDR